MIGGITVIVRLFSLTATPLVEVTIGLFLLCFAALVEGNGAIFQMFSLCWLRTTTIAGGMIGEIGALGDSILPIVLG